MPHFVHHDLRLLDPSFSSPLLDVLTDLEHLRRLEFRVSTSPAVFSQLRRVFHLLESLASARIEGNHTTLADVIETKLGGDRALQGSDPIREISNIEEAMDLIEEHVGPGSHLSEYLIRTLHATAVAGLEREGDRQPGSYRSVPVTIAQSDHVPPDALHVPVYMAELVNFVNAADAPKYDLMKVALAHHRFAWIHPFGNGNGRVVRLFTYALLIKYGFKVSADDGRILNPAAVFCADRAKYYDMLGRADLGTDESLECWCTYVLSGIRDELEKVARLADYASLKTEVLFPALAHARQRQWVTEQEHAVLSAAVKGGVVKSRDLSDALPGLKPAQRTYVVGKLVNSGMLQPIHENARQYTIGFSNNALLKGVVKSLADRGFISKALES